MAFQLGIIFIGSVAANLILFKIFPLTLHPYPMQRKWVVVHINSSCYSIRDHQLFINRLSLITLNSSIRITLCGAILLISKISRCTHSLGSKLILRLLSRERSEIDIKTKYIIFCTLFDFQLILVLVYSIGHPFI